MQFDSSMPRDLAAATERMRRLARALVGNAHDAEDVAQEAWCQALRSGSAAEDADAWLSGVARNVARHHGRAGKRRIRREAAAARPESQSPDQLALDHIEAVHSLVTVVRSLPQPYRSALVLQYVVGMAPAEAAKALGVNRATIRSRVHRGLDMVRTNLARRPGEDRRSWQVAIAPLVASATRVTLGGLLVAKATYWAGAALLLLLIGAGSLWLMNLDVQDGAVKEVATSQGMPPVLNASAATEPVLQTAQRPTPAAPPPPEACNKTLWANGSKPTQAALDVLEQHLNELDAACFEVMPLAWKLALLDRACSSRIEEGSFYATLAASLVRTLARRPNLILVKSGASAENLVCLVRLTPVDSDGSSKALADLLRQYMLAMEANGSSFKTATAAVNAFLRPLLDRLALEPRPWWLEFWVHAARGDQNMRLPWRAFLREIVKHFPDEAIRFAEAAVDGFAASPAALDDNLISEAGLALQGHVARSEFTRSLLLDGTAARRWQYLMAIDRTMQWPSGGTPVFAEVVRAPALVAALLETKQEEPLHAIWRAGLATSLFRYTGPELGSEVLAALLQEQTATGDRLVQDVVLSAILHLAMLEQMVAAYAKHASAEVQEAAVSLEGQADGLMEVLARGLAGSTDKMVKGIHTRLSSPPMPSRARPQQVQYLRRALTEARANRLFGEIATEAK